MPKSGKEISEIPKDIDEIFIWNMVEYYEMRPNQDDPRNICLAVFASHYLKPAKVENDYRSDFLTHNASMIDSLGLTLHKKVKLSSTCTREIMR